MSQATVSKVLSNKSDNIHISAKTRLAVIEAAKRLGYNQNKIAAALIQLVEETIAILAEHIANPYASVVMKGVEQELSQTKYRFLFASSNGDPDQSVQTIESLTRRFTTGFILMPFYECNTSQSVRQFLKSRGIPFVQTSYYNLPGENDAPLICTNNFEVFKNLTEHLIGLGHKRIAFVYTSPEYSSIDQRIRGFKSALSDAGLEAHDRHLICLPRTQYYDIEPKQQLLDEWLAADDGPTAIMTLKDDAAIQFMRLAERRGLRVPDDMAVTGFDDYRHFIPNLLPDAYFRLTTVRQNLPEIGRQAVLRLIDEIESEDARSLPMEVVVPGRIIVRGSCGASPAPETADQDALEVPGARGHFIF